MRYIILCIGKKTEIIFKYMIPNKRSIIVYEKQKRFCLNKNNFY